MTTAVEPNETRFEGLDSLSPDVEIDVSELPGGRVLRGREAVQSYVDSLLSDVWQELSMEVEAITEQDDVTVALIRFRAIGRGSGVPVEMTAAWMATMRGGRVARARLTLDRRPALQAARATQ